MSASYDSENDRIILQGLGTGYGRCKKELPTPPSGANSITIIMRYWLDGDSDFANTFAWDPAFFVGLKFDGNYPSDVDDRSQYNNFFGLHADNDGYAYPDSNRSHYVTVGDAGDPFLYLRNQLGASYTEIRSAHAYPGSGVAIRSVDTDNNDPLAAWTFPNQEVEGLKHTVCWRIYGNGSDNGVNGIAWVADNSFDLSTLDLSGSIEDQLPPHGNNSDSFEIHGDEFGTNWRPTDGGDMAFPTHFMLSYPMSENSLVLDYAAVVYGE